MKNKLEIIKKRKDILAIIIYNNYHTDGTKFFSPDSFSQQLAYISHKKGHIIEAHIHNVIKREINFTQETLVIKKGKIKVNFYDSAKKYIGSRILNSGDVILLARGGHEFKVLEDVEMIEIKQGPYLAEKDKIRFEGRKK